MTIIVRDGKYINTDTPEEAKNKELKALGERVTQANR